MIDKEDRNSARFPAWKETIVCEEIEMRLKTLKDTGTNIIGIAGGACGGDILFHELCHEMNIRTEMYLALPVTNFKKESVSFAGENWDTRFDKLIAALPVHILAEPEEKTESDSVWERCNLWMLDTALQNGGGSMTLIAVWDKKGGDGKGGTEHMVKVANDQNANVEIIDINNLQE